MFRCLVLTCLILVSALPVSAQTGALCLFSDAGATECSFVDSGGLVRVYVVHTQSGGATGSQFCLDVSETGWSFLGDNWNYPVAIGNSIDGVSIGYGACLSSPLVVGTASFMGTTVPAGTAIRVIPDPDAGDHVLVVNCDARTMLAAGGTAYVNSQAPCVCESNQEPTLLVDPPTMDFGYIDSVRTFEVVNIGGGTLTWNLSESIAWLTLSTYGGVNTEVVTATIDRSQAPSGSSQETIEIMSNAGSETILVNITVYTEEPVLAVSGHNLAIGGFQESISFLVVNQGTGDLEWNITTDRAWLTIDPVSGVNSTEVSVTVDRTGLAEGTHYGNLFVTSNGGSETVVVTVTVPPIDPVLDVSPISLSFGLKEQVMYIDISNLGQSDLEWAITSSDPWLSVAPDAGTNNKRVVVTVDRTILDTGDYAGSLEITSNSGSATVDVSVEVGRRFLNINPQTLYFENNMDELYFDISFMGRLPVYWHIDNHDNSWLLTDLADGVNDARVTVRVDRTGLADGNYTGVLTVSTEPYIQPKNVDIYLTVGNVDPFPTLDVSPTALDFGATEFQESLHISNAGTAILNWSIEKDVVWLKVRPVTGTGDRTVDVELMRGILPDGDNQAHLLITSNGGEITVPVSAWGGTSPPDLAVSPSSLCFLDTENVKSLHISNAGGNELNWSITIDQAWLSAEPAAGLNDALVYVQIDRTGLADGAHSATLLVTSNGGDTTVPVNTWIGPVPPVLRVHPTLLEFSESHTEDEFAITNVGGSELDWSVHPTEPWISTDINGGAGPYLVTVNVDPAGVPPGQTVDGYIFVDSDGGSETVTVRFDRPPPPVSTLYIYSDSTFSGVQFDDDGPSGGLIPVYFVLTDHSGIGFLVFSLESMSLDWQLISENWNYTGFSGTVEEGINFIFDPCLPETKYLGVVWFSSSNPQDCGRLLFSGAFAMDCEYYLPDGEPVELRTNMGYVNWHTCCDCVPVQHTTWGRIKAMYAPPDVQISRPRN